VNTLDDLRKEAKHWLKGVRTGNPGYVKRLRLALPKAPASPTLRDVQHALARERGYESWKALRAAFERQTVTGTPPQHSDPASHFLGFACWDQFVHGLGDYRVIEAAAMRLLHKHPEIRSASVYTAAACGDLEAVTRLLDERPELVNQKGGVRGWEPLLYLCYARLPLESLRDGAVAVARLLLDRGANPNAYYMGGAALYGTLVGVAGVGEQDAPPHAARDALYALLLERGAEPYDIQVLYNTHFRGDVLWWLRLTWQHSIATGRERDWQDPELRIFDMGGYGSGARFLLWLAIQKNDRELAEFLLARGANPNSAPPPAPTLPQMSLYRYALIEGRQEIAELLLRSGAIDEGIGGEDEDAFTAACMRVDRHAARALADRHRDYLRSPRTLFAAARDDRPDVMALLLELGVPVNLQDERKQTALHAAAAHDARAAATFLIERGADVDVREASWHATPLGFASHHDHREMIDLLSRVSGDVWSLALHGKIDRLREVLAGDPERARDAGPHGSTLLWCLPNDEAVALDVVDILLASGVDPSVKDEQGSTAADSARALGMERVAARLAQAAPS
jgi:ankyrin repeat protein